MKTLDKKKRQLCIRCLIFLNANTHMEKIWKKHDKMYGKISVNLTPHTKIHLGNTIEDIRETSNIFGISLSSN